MTKLELANQLRQRQLDAGAQLRSKRRLSFKDFTKMIQSVTDDEIIKSYSTCACCGRSIDPVKLENLIRDAVDSFGFSLAVEKILIQMHLN